MNSFYVYFIYDPEFPALPIYVGKGSGNRAWTHITEPSTLNRRDRLHNKLRSMLAGGVQPQIEIQDQDLTNSEACHIERHYIKHFGRWDKGEGPLLNFTDGGEGSLGFKHTEESKRKLSLANRGYKHTDAAKLKIRNSKLGKPRPMAMRIKLSQIKRGRPIVAYWAGLDVIYKEYEYLAQVKEDGFSHGNVWQVLHRHQAIAYGLEWRYKDELPQDPKS